MVTTRSQSKKLAKEAPARPLEQEKAEAKNQHQPNGELKDKVKRILGFLPTWFTDDNPVLKHPQFNRENTAEAEAWYQFVKKENNDPRNFDYEDFYYEEDNSHWWYSK